MLPILGLLYSLALIDRTNLGVARIAGMGEDLVSTTRPILPPQAQVPTGLGIICRNTL